MSELKEYSFSSVEDVYDFLNKLSFIYEKKEKNEELLHYYLDFLRLIDKVDDNRYIVTYHDVKVGRYNQNNIVKKVRIEEMCASVLRIELDKFNKGLMSNVEDIVEKNRQEWFTHINKKYKNRIIERTPSKRKNNVEIINKQTTKDISDAKKIKLTKKQEQQKEEDLNGLYEYLNSIENNLEFLSKNGRKGTSEYKKLTSIKIQVQKDINIVRKSYGEILGNQNSMGRRSFISYNSESPNYQYIVSAHEKYLSDLENDQIYDFNREEKLKEIKNIAKNILTNRQYIIFEFYYFNRLTQQEIADLMGLKQPTINEHISNIIDKIKKNL